MPILNTPNFLFHNALDFFDIGKERTKEIFEIDPNDNPSLWYHISAPAVNLAFSLELMLKAVLLIENGKIEKENKQHRLKELFQNISPDAKKEIIDILLSSQSEVKYPALRFSKKETVQGRISREGQTIEEKILDLLSIHDNSFVSWRYSFELSNLENQIEFIEFNFGEMIHFINATAKYLKTSLEKIDKSEL